MLWVFKRTVSMTDNAKRPFICFHTLLTALSGSFENPKHVKLMCKICLFVWFDSLRPINNLSVNQGWVFLG